MQRMYSTRFFVYHAVGVFLPIKVQMYSVQKKQCDTFFFLCVFVLHLFTIIPAVTSELVSDSRE